MCRGNILGDRLTTLPLLPPSSPPFTCMFSHGVVPSVCQHTVWFPAVYSSTVQYIHCILHLYSEPSLGKCAVPVQSDVSPVLWLLVLCLLVSGILTTDVPTPISDAL